MTTKYLGPYKALVVDVAITGMEMQPGQYMDEVGAQINWGVEVPELGVGPFEPMRVIVSRVEVTGNIVTPGEFVDHEELYQEVICNDYPYCIKVNTIKWDHTVEWLEPKDLELDLNSKILYINF